MIDKNSTADEIINQLVSIGKTNLMQHSMTYLINLKHFSTVDKMNVAIGLCDKIWWAARQEIKDVYLKKLDSEGKHNASAE